MISFTGSTAVGKRIMAQRRRHAEARVPRARRQVGEHRPRRRRLRVGARAARAMVCMHAGQGCAITTRLLLPRARYDEGVEIAEGRVRERSRTATRNDLGNMAGPLINATQRERVLGYIEKGKAEGARCVVGGGRPDAVRRRATSCSRRCSSTSIPTRRSRRRRSSARCCRSSRTRTTTTRCASPTTRATACRASVTSGVARPGAGGRPAHPHRHRVGERRPVVRPRLAVRRLQGERLGPRARHRRASRSTSRPRRSACPPSVSTQEPMANTTQCREVVDARLSAEVRSRSRRSGCTASSGSPPRSACSAGSASTRASPGTSPPATRSTPTTSGSTRSAMNFSHIRVSDLILVNRRRRGRRGRRAREPRPRSRSTRRCTRPGPTSSPPRTRTRCYGKAWSSLGRAPRPAHPGRVRVLRGPRAVRRLHRRRARPRGGQAHRPRARRQQGRRSCATTGCSPSGTRSTRPRGGSSRWSARARRSSSPRPPAHRARSTTSMARRHRTTRSARTSPGYFTLPAALGLDHPRAARPVRLTTDRPRRAGAVRS